MPEVSIIIPTVQINDYIRESIPHILNMDYIDFEVIIFPDMKTDEVFEKTIIIPTGKIGPAQKRDLAIKFATGKILAFLDDDAYPEKDWLIIAVKHFIDDKVYAVGGPAITPSDDSFWQRVSGAVFMTVIGGGNPDRYWPIGNIKVVDDWPSVNLLVRKDIFSEIGGFNSKYWPGEDTKLCLDLTERGGIIIYDPAVRVRHHRRGGFFKHLKQIGSYGLHRGYFAKKYPGNSFKYKYFVPSLFDIYVVISIITLLFYSSISLYFIAGYVLYLLALIYGFFDIYKKEKKFLVSFSAIIYIIFTHLWYGVKFIIGFLFTKELKSKLHN